MIEDDPPQRQVVLDPRKLLHIFRKAPGHLSDTPEHRVLLIETASRPECLVGRDAYGNDWYARTLDDGRQVWAQVRGGLIRNGGANDEPRPFDSKAGFGSVR